MFTKTVTSKNDWAWSGDSCITHGSQSKLAAGNATVLVLHPAVLPPCWTRTCQPCLFHNSDLVVLFLPILIFLFCCLGL